MLSSYATYRQPYLHPAIRNTAGMTVGGVSFGYGDVVAYDVQAVVERDWDGQLLCAGIYGLFAGLFLIGVLLGMDWKYVIAVVFLGTVAFMSVCDAIGVKPVTIHVLDLTLWDGRKVRFVDADPRVVDALIARIEEAGQVLR